MTREIKFRAWDAADEMMYCDVQLGILFDDGSHYPFERFLGNQDEGDYHEWYLMQFTGLKDRNGVDIYEGDVVKASVRSGRSVTSDVKFFPEYGVFGLTMVPHYYNRKTDPTMPLGSSGSSTPYKPFTWKSYKSLEIIGNIYEDGMPEVSRS